MEWHNICYDIPLPRKQRKAAQAQAQVEEAPVTAPTRNDLPSPAPGMRRLLDGVQGSVQRGEQVAILGASGAGKTTLLNVLSARLDSTGDLTGRVTFEGKARDPSSWKRTVGFVEQDDVLISLLTVREILDYAARLRLPAKLFNRQAKRDRVEEVIDALRMEKCQDTRIGNGESRGVSGGERKRASIGTELVSDVSLLLLDEPTSGLDSFQAYNVVDILREVARKRNLACLMTIHQPSWKIFSLFDKVILLTRGSVYYDGPPGEAPAYFESLGLPTPHGSNPADHFINIAENLDRTDESEKRVLSLISSWDAHQKQKGFATPSAAELEGKEEEGGKKEEAEREAGKKVEAEKSSSSSSSAAGVDSSHLRAYQEWPTSWLAEMRILAHRKYIQIIRNPVTLIGTAGQTIVLLIIIGFAFFRLGYSQADVLARIGVLFFVPINSSFAVIFPIIGLFPQQRLTMKRERSSGLYRTSSFYVAEVLVEIPAQIAQRVLFYVILYWMIGLKPTGAAFFIFLGVNFMQVLTAIGIGLLIGSLSPNIDIANILAPLFNVIMLLFGGNLLPSPPPWFVWLRWISPITYAYAALSINEFSGAVYQCDDSSGGMQSQCYRTGEAILQQYNMQRFTIGQNTLFLLAIAVVWIVAGYVALRFLAHPRFRYL